MSYNSLCLSERQQIFILSDAECKLVDIAKEINRHVSTISRELKRCVGFKNWDKLSSLDKAKLANDNALFKRGPKRRREVVLKNYKIQDYVVTKLQAGWSPETISLEIQKDIGESISHEAIYLFIYRHRKDLVVHLVRKGRTPRQGYKRDRVNIFEQSKRSHLERSSECLNREELGHLESDLIVSCKGGRASLQVTVERVSRRIWIKLLSSREACEARRNLLQVLLSETSLISCTVDNGGEHAEYPNLEQVFKERDFMVYFCDPHSPWQRGSVEAINGILRRWFPKGTNFDKVTEERVKEVESLFNGRPMRVLGNKKPIDVWNELQLKVA